MGCNSHMHRPMQSLGRPPGVWWAGARLWVGLGCEAWKTGIVNPTGPGLEYQGPGPAFPGNYKGVLET